MKDKPTNGELAIILENISTNVDNGFVGVHERQDETNGNVKLNTEYRLKQIGAINLMKVIGIGNLIAVVGLLLDRFLN